MRSRSFISFGTTTPAVWPPVVTFRVYMPKLNKTL
jgi:hypothetical protein